MGESVLPLKQKACSVDRTPTHCDLTEIEQHLKPLQTRPLQRELAFTRLIQRWDDLLSVKEIITDQRRKEL